MDKFADYLARDVGVAKALAYSGMALVVSLVITIGILARLPISERVESLNVSNAAAVALYELTRDA